MNWENLPNNWKKLQKNWWRKRKIRELKRKRSEFQKKKDDYFIPWKDDPKFKNKVQILEIEKSLEELKEYATENGLINKFKFTEIKHDDVIDFNDESIFEFFKSLNFIFHILIPGPTGTGKTYLSEAFCNLLKKNMIIFFIMKK